MKALGWGLLTFALFALVGCGNDDSETPAAKCSRLQATYVGRLLDCFVELACVPAAERDAEYQDLLAQVRQGAPDCGRTVEVGPSYDECISSIKGTSCMAFADPS